MEIAAVLGPIVLLSPALLLAVLGSSSMIDRPLPERNINGLARLTMVTGLLAALGVLMAMLIEGTRLVTVLSAEWIRLPHYHFVLKFVFDRLSVPLVILTFLLCGVIVSFATRYMHRERGYNRFFTLFAIFIVGMVTACLAGTIETLFVGWELVGLSSALLVAFLQERPAPVRSGLHIWIIYRVSDAALLLAAILMHHMLGEGDFGRLLATNSLHPWPEGATVATAVQALVIGLLLVIAAAGKSALVPFSGWLPRAMEGPTPSSAVFYGALSVHLGAFLLLRMNPLLVASHALALLVIVLGLVTAIYAHLVGSVQTDIKSVLSFASLTQVGLIVAEIGLGAWIPALWYVALAHLLGHACVRTLQFVRAPMLLQDYRRLEGAIGGRLRRPDARYLHLLPVRFRSWIYIFALERGYLDSILMEFVVAPFVNLFRGFDKIERQWGDFLAGRRPSAASTTSAQAQPVADVARPVP
ncbi:MAG TPA: proton-conducting transporter membrane subunit [Gemmataceae bacterium]|nr:proton-conducting transporter membrane subunit [Gemmataceae bacterium]